MNFTPTAHPTEKPVPARWLIVLRWLVLIGAGGSAVGILVDARHFVFSWLLGFMFFLSVCVGAFFLVIAHHLFDAAWSVPIRRLCEHMACLVFPWLALMFVPIALLTPWVYPWAQEAGIRNTEAFAAAHALLNRPMWTLLSVVMFGAWWWLSRGLRRWSLEQDSTGAAICTYRLRRYSAGGAFLLAVTVTLAAVLWMKSLAPGWFSAIYGACYFSSSVWFTVAVVWLLAMILKRAGLMQGVLGSHQFRSLGILMLAFTLFHAYMHYSQYFVVWNANLPQETAWYVARERGTWRHIGLTLVLGHFLVPFMILLRSETKLNVTLSVSVCLWACLMHYLEISFHVMPNASPEGLPLRSLWMDVAGVALMGGLLSRVFLRDFSRHPPYPVCDPRLSEILACVDDSLGEPIPGRTAQGADLRSDRTGAEAPSS